MKFLFSVGLIASVSLTSAVAQQTYSAFVREVTIESINAAPDNSSLWMETYHDRITIGTDDTDLVLGDLVSAFPIGKGLWFGLYSENASGDIELIASKIIGAQPTSVITVTSLDLDTNDDSTYTEPITRADVPFTVTIDVTNISDDGLLQQSSTGDDVVDDLVTIAEYPPATKYMKLTRHTSEPDDNGVEVEALIDSAYTYGEGQVFLTREDDLSDVTSHTYAEDEVLSLLATGVTDFTAVNGREIYKTHVVPDYSWNGEDPDNTSFVETEEASIRVLPTAFADPPTDANDRPVEGELYYTLPNIEWNAKNLYPRSDARISLYQGSPDDAAAVAISDTVTNISATNVQDDTVYMDLTVNSDLVDQEGVSYTAVLETKTPIDFDGDGSIEDEGWEEIDRVSFYYNGEINVNAVIVTGE